jgi:hypothetical protein
VRPEVRVLPDPPRDFGTLRADHGAIAQLGEHLLCKQGVVGSIPTGSTKLFYADPSARSLTADPCADCPRELAPG